MQVSEEFLTEVLNKFSSNLVGKIMKRFEISNNLDVIKSQTKELIYEEGRALKDNIIAFGLGYECKTVIFKSKGKQDGK